MTDALGMGDCGDVPWCFWESEYWHFKSRWIVGDNLDDPNLHPSAPIIFTSGGQTNPYGPRPYISR